MFDRHHDSRVRAAAFAWLTGQVETHGDVLPWAPLAAGFHLDGRRVPLVSQQGIFKPKILSDAPLSIRASPSGPYDDTFGADGLLRYRYRGTNPDHPDNRRLRFTMQERLPLVYFHGIVPGKYVAAWPAFVVADEPSALAFTIAVDEEAYAGLVTGSAEDALLVRDDREDVRRQYVTAAVQQRLHQRAFRERVLQAYRHQCAFCRFRHQELLDAAHIVPDADPTGEPVVPNGLALCKLHHAAFDRHFLGVRPDFTVEVRPDLLREQDGPTLVHAIQALQGVRILLPRRLDLRPRAEFLEVHYNGSCRAQRIGDALVARSEVAGPSAWGGWRRARGRVVKRKTETQEVRVARIKQYLKTKPNVPCEFFEIGEATDVPKSRIDYQRSLSSDPEVRREMRKDQHGRYRVYWTFVGGQ